MRQRLEDFGGSGHPLLFAHANGYPVGSYRQFIEVLSTQCRVTGFHLRPMWSAEQPPVMLDWEQFAGDLVDTLDATADGPVWMMGHSMGAVVSAQAAGARPDLFRGLILIDPVFIPPELLAARAEMSLEQTEQMPLVQKTLGRPERFDSLQDAFDFYRDKRAFADFSDESLWDYVNASKHPTDDGDYELVYSREWEAAAYRSAPEVWDTLASIELPVLGLRGETSTTLMPEAFSLWGQVQPQADLRVCRGGHLLPLEHPRDTAAAVLDFLASQAPG